VPARRPRGTTGALALSEPRPLGQVRTVALREHCRSSTEAPRAVAELGPALEALDRHLAAKGPFLLGESFTLADICGVCALIDVFRLALPAPLRALYSSLLHWLEVCLAMPVFKAFGGVGALNFREWPVEEAAAFADHVAEATKSRTSGAVPNESLPPRFGPAEEGKTSAVPPFPSRPPSGPDLEPDGVCRAGVDAEGVDTFRMQNAGHDATRRGPQAPQRRQAVLNGAPPDGRAAPAMVEMPVALSGTERAGWSEWALRMGAAIMEFVAGEYGIMPRLPLFSEAAGSERASSQHVGLRTSPDAMQDPWRPMGQSGCRPWTR